MTKAVLSESLMPTHWYNLAADFPEPMPPHLNPGTKEPITAEEMSALFATGLCEQEFSTERYIEIPEPVREIYTIWRPSPLARAPRLEKALGTSARIYYKNESVSPIGSHKPNTSIAQAYYNKLDGIEKLTTETGAGQWGASLAFAGQFFEQDVEVWQVRASYDSKPYRRMLMDVYGATVHPSPSDLTEAGRNILAKHPDTPGSLGMAVSEAIEVAMGSDNARYALGSVLNHVMLHQTIIGQEAIRQLEMFGEIDGPDMVVGCAGGGSNLAGLTFPFIGSNLQGLTDARIVAAEPAKCPSLTKGEYRYDHGDVAGMTPLLKMHTLGQDFVPDPIHAGGLRYHAMSPMVSHAMELGLLEATAITQEDAFAAGVLFARTEGTVPAPESNHAIAAALTEARKHTGEPGTGPVILLGLSGNGFLDLPAYSQFI
ncbi:TrpB-like pyridoxal phosphate-dependent enzyme [Corynebacterium sp. TAE3-ERU12]|uniref:TrpB-like pyridoxal phosphate-dependent enzyme n=1 Tax=Corynebacterium sp. TAE3-ERU12 TaxID=2849491 RepID=UPI001C440B71|nr:TrpB-like pyridoxal phosphate-dependent enzyme [Corynebacterium sp. TAE3-ERU12]MBV7295811.1 TrpB-like pyridoxal phosphate-dependent enzyme [Corynebacterium sp. TAE3-ERU12]